ncbi:Rsd/AlgQ family anti-sigma factor [Candidatus Methylobacter oryzae]|uniref:Rsd/AlgQ family anti-sigma factor n=1 Tax=Candidatus Methylobacter oryzae TaxID=2497749 RepID=A0ABY3C9P7_9GAMM|nr:Rsd/AlgQ family anti-sigma factor [Candidatus Methylobacter oryzae]TRW94433.1 Rsd/AlgQ family anti-sigma factor [Candidatus Methylobacter oryzae]
MSIAVQLNPERKQQAHQLIAELQHERQQVWFLYCHVAALMPFSANPTVRKKLARFSEILIDYVSLGHFGICECLFRDADSQDPALSAAEQIYPALSSTTDAAVSFNDKYEGGAAIVLDDLKQDLSALGENLAKRIDLEDRLCELMLQ